MLVCWKQVFDGEEKTCFQLFVGDKKRIFPKENILFQISFSVDYASAQGITET